jgi:hypothetical protein
VLAISRRGLRGRALRVVNAYFQRVGREGDHRPTEKARWNEILAEDNCVLAGDDNARSTIWSPRYTNRRNSTFLEDLIRSFEVCVLNDERPTRPSDGLHT